MLCGFQVVLKFLLGRMHGLMRSQRRFELAAACAPSLLRRSRQAKRLDELVRQRYSLKATSLIKKNPLTAGRWPQLLQAP